MRVPALSWYENRRRLPSGEIAVDPLVVLTRNFAVPSATSTRLKAPWMSSAVSHVPSGEHAVTNPAPTALMLAPSESARYTVSAPELRLLNTTWLVLLHVDIDTIGSPPLISVVSFPSPSILKSPARS